MIELYELDGSSRIKKIDVSTEEGMLEWSKLFEEKDRIIARDEVGGYLISTVFLGIDHNFCGDREPLLFETMVFGGSGEYTDYQERHSTNSQAVRRHYAIVREIGESMTFFGRVKNFIANVKRALRLKWREV